MKSKLWAYWKVDLKKQISSIDYDNYSPWVRTDLVFDPQAGTVDLMWMTNLETSEFKGINYKEMSRYGSSVEDYLPSSKFSPTMASLYRHDFVNYCTVSNDEVRTYDNVTYGYQMHDCWTMVSADCSEKPTFAVFMKKDQANKIAIWIQMGGQTVEIKPAGYSSYELTIDEDEIELEDQESFLYPSQTKVYSGVTEKYEFRVHKWDNTFSVDIPFITTINYDGHQIQTIASPFLKGKQCGMCGDFNRNKRFEFVGPEDCQLKNGNEMAAAYSWAEGEEEECPETPECSTKDYSFSEIVNIY